MQKYFFSFLILSTLLSSCMDQPAAPIEYGNKATSSANKYANYDNNEEIVEKPIIREKTIWGDQQVENMSTGYPPSESDVLPLSSTETPIRTETILHEVIEGETIDTVAKQYNIDRESIIKANNLKAPYELEELQILQIPPQSIETVSSDTVEDVIIPNSMSETSQAKAAIEKYTLPVMGSIISKFGENYLGTKNNGINIKSPLGSEIHSASTGKVVYSGNDQKFGNLIIVKSENEDIFIAYSHMEDLILKANDSVVKSQLIGHVGQTGNVTFPQLHLAVRRGKTPIDPEKYLNK